MWRRSVAVSGRRRRPFRLALLSKNNQRPAQSQPLPDRFPPVAGQGIEDRLHLVGIDDFEESVAASRRQRTELPDSEMRLEQTPKLAAVDPLPDLARFHWVDVLVSLEDWPVLRR